MSYTRLFNSALKSSLNPSIPRRLKSGLKLTLVYGLILVLVIVGFSMIFKLSLNYWTYFWPVFASTVSILPQEDQIKTSLNPKPFLPPTIFFSLLS